MDVCFPIPSCAIRHGVCSFFLIKINRTFNIGEALGMEREWGKAYAWP